MSPTHSQAMWPRLRAAVVEGTRNSVKTTLWLLSIMIPVSFAVFLLRWFGVLRLVGQALGPVFVRLDLPGASGLAFLSGLLINLYSGIAVMGELALNLREVTILALMNLVAHNFLVELTVMRTTGSHPVRMILLRLIAALAAGFALTVLLPDAMSEMHPFEHTREEVVISSTGELEAPTFGTQLKFWAAGSIRLVAKLALILLALMIGERLMQELGIVRWLGKRLRFLMRIFGLPEDVAFLWVVSNTLGLAYGAGILKKEVDEGRLSRADGDLLNHHMAACHSLLEDTLLFVALGVPAFWITIPRLVLAMVAVWGRRAELRLRRGKPVGT